MKLRWQLALIAGLALVAADPALARARHHKAAPRCIDHSAPFSWHGFFFNGPQQANGCTPPVYEYGHYIGQDPDPNIRAQLMRQPRTGYTFY